MYPGMEEEGEEEAKNKNRNRNRMKRRKKKEKKRRRRMGGKGGALYLPYLLADGGGQWEVSRSP